ncbi:MULTISPECIES: oligosaccharide flippase family protein [unclassified Sphingomonas]|uniref:oligosaccharide flippase family protein n=1 Tax=unclassified Sphingomonas TaxID=196159 RepID=UPI0009E885F3|nr:MULTISPECIES: oligosaccharide flippase family protein [unclassified Sphingomonas]
MENSAVENRNESMKRTLRSTGLIGGATVISLLVGLGRMKVIALLTGPAGVGLFGLLNVLWSTGSALAGLNLGVSGVRQISEHDTDTEARSLAESAVWYFALVAAVVGGVGLWGFERFYTEGAGASPTVPWIALAVAVAVINAAQLVFLQVYSRIGDIARIRIYGSVLGAIAGVIAVAATGTPGLYMAVLAMPLASLLVTVPYFRRVPRMPWRRFDKAVLGEWRALLMLGIGVSVAAWIGNFGQLWVRWIITERGNLQAAGFFQAAYTLTNVNLSIVLAAMSVEYFPKLSSSADNSSGLTDILNEQYRLALILSAPILISAVAAAPWVMPLLYSKDFSNAVPLFQWQVAADSLKILSWALGYILIVTRSALGFIAAELAFDVFLVGVPWIFFATLGLDSIAVGYAAGLISSVAVSVILSMRRGVRLSWENWAVTLVVCASAVGICLVSIESHIAGLMVGMLVATVFGVRGLKAIGAADAAIGERLRRIIGKFKGSVRL